MGKNLFGSEDTHVYAFRASARRANELVGPTFGPYLKSRQLGGVDIRIEDPDTVRIQLLRASNEVAPSDEFDLTHPVMTTSWMNASQILGEELFAELAASGCRFYYVERKLLGISIFRAQSQEDPLLPESNVRLGGVPVLMGSRILR